MTREPLLHVEGLRASYGPVDVLFGVSLAVGAGEVATLMGRNGMGKTTTVSAVMGLLRPRGGSVLFGGEPVHGLAPHRIARLGIGLVPEGRRIFRNLTVRENLAMARIDRGGGDGWTIERVYALFPRLQARQANLGTQLSGGEQQMLAIGRALMTNPRLVILDEATEGLAPVVRDEIWACLEGLKRAGLSILVIDKEVEALCEIADRHHVLEKGEVVWSGSSDDLRADATVRERFLGV